MNIPASGQHSSCGFELCFRSLGEAQTLAFPCDATGHIDLDALTRGQRLDYFFARSLIGRDFARPAVRERLVH